eukprot:CAMPEP_0184479338 /NCGR_PEP_ID=MMETSP0113_2-20130426/1103_1 /TAXON_ID=91329 /ORGANISM="Norrisiella sphaerica, Strain BC52" /LENGTH=674 /DNA_ID=CAMNT_0026857397 /DNA_START=164 /DNA_END=2188 /DNA_ORIENTATION=+
MEVPEGFAEALKKVDYDEVREDLKKLFTDSKDFWPADYGNYGPLFVRLAWHNAGSYRISDGRGGADGGRQRFDPERSWPDNTNLDKARKLLWPIKVKHGVGLSWGDLIVLAGNTAIESMGGPILGFCGGRIDDPDGTASEPLGPTAVQEDIFPCPVNGKCDSPLGSTTVGLIYLNPEGPMGNPDPEGSSKDVRDAFARMAMNDSETVALIGGGHAFGKSHGACRSGAGPSPKQDPFNPWPGTCGSGKGAEAFTSGFEGPWTPSPTRWDNDYFVNLLKYQWKPRKGPGGHYQWHVANDTSPMAPGPQGGNQSIMALTSDVSLIKDPTGRYPKIVRNFAESPEEFGSAFAHAWYKLTTRDMGPVTRCVGKHVPPAQPFQYPLPPTPPISDLANFTEVVSSVRAVLGDSSETARKSPLAPLFVRLAWRCASTFRQTDYQGGCNGARIRFSPQADWSVTAGLNKALDALTPVKDKFGKGLSWADLIVLAGSVAVEVASGNMTNLSFCGGRTDAEDGLGSQYLTPRVTGDITDELHVFRDTITVMGLTLREFTALSGAHSFGRMHANVSGYQGAWTPDPTVLSNDYYQVLLSETWEPVSDASKEKKYFKAAGKELYMLKTDLMLLADPELRAFVEEFANSEKTFLDAFVSAWVKLMNADRFDGPLGNVCDHGFSFSLQL